MRAQAAQLNWSLLILTNVAPKPQIATTTSSVTLQTHLEHILNASKPAILTMTATADYCPWANHATP